MTEVVDVSAFNVGGDDCLGDLVQIFLQSQIGGHWLIQGEKVHRQVINLNFNLIDALFVAKYFFRRRPVFLRNRSNAALNGCLHERAHLEQLGFQQF